MGILDDVVDVRLGSSFIQEYNRRGLQWPTNKCIGVGLLLFEGRKLSFL